MISQTYWSLLRGIMLPYSLPFLFDCELEVERENGLLHEVSATNLPYSSFAPFVLGLVRRGCVFQPIEIAKYAGKNRASIISTNDGEWALLSSREG